MYKDVWKRFGTKILIVFCSVLLLGGVAIAAPRLRADQQKYTFADLKNATIELAEEVQYNYGEKVYPEKIKVTGQTVSGSAIDLTLERGTDYTIGQEGTITGVTNGKTAYVTIEPKNSNKIITTLIDGSEDNTSLEVYYEISKRELETTEVDINFITTYSYDNLPTNTSGYWVVNSLPASFEGKDWEVTVKEEGKNPVTLTYGSDYQIENSEATSLGAYSKPITFTNFEVPGSSVSTDVYMNVESLECSIESDELVVKRKAATGDITLEKNIHYTAKEENGQWTIRGIWNKGGTGAEKAYYVGIKIYSSGTAGSGNYALQHDALQSPVDYVNDLHRTIQQNPRSVWVQDRDTGRTITLGENAYTKTFAVATERGNEDFKDGRTAGWVRLALQAGSPYNVATNTWYKLRRALAANEMGWVLEPTSPDETYTYNTNYHEVKPIIHFNDSEKYTLIEGQDYELSYCLVCRNGVDVITTTDPKRLINAGEVYITIIGKAGKDATEKPNEAGYYGEIDPLKLLDVKGLKYTIEPLDLEEEGYNIALQNDYMQRNDVFDVTCQKAEVLEKVWLVNSERSLKLKDVANNDVINTNEYEVTFTSGGEVISDDDWGSLKPGQYTIEIDFKGNLDGVLTQTFTIEEYKESEIRIEYEECSEGDGKDHIYTGRQHRPRVTGVTYKNIPIDLDSCTIDYGENIESGTRIGTIMVTVPGNVTKTERFDIAKRELQSEYIKLPETDFPNGEHEYCGKGKAPDLKTLEYRYTTANGSNKTMTLEKDKDYTVDPGLFDKDGRDIDLTNIDIGNTEYYFKIRPINNCKTEENNREYVLAGEFKFKQRSIRPAYIKCEIDAPMPYTKGDKDDEFIKYLGTNRHLTVEDTTFGDHLVYNTDYTISITKNDVENTGTVIFSINGTGCYNDVKEELTLYVGNDIVNAQIQERNKFTIYFDEVERYAKLQWPEYKKSDDVVFMKEGDSVANTVLLRYQNLSGSFKSLYYGEEYSVEFDPDVYTEGSGPTAQRYGIARIQGKNGYFGKVSIRFDIKRVDLEKEGYSIIIVDQESDYYVYNGEPIDAMIRVVKYDSDGNILDELEDNEYEAVCSNHTDATEDFTLNSQKAVVTVTGLYGYSGTITAVYDIWKLDLGTKKQDDLGNEYIGMAGGFSLEGLKMSPNAYEYTQMTTLSTGEKKAGVWPEVKIVFNNGRKTFVLNDPEKQQCEYVCYNNENVCDAKTPYDNRARVRVTPTSSNHNFKGEFNVLFDIAAVDLENPNKCEVRLSPQRMPFVGDKELQHPEVNVYQIKENGQRDKIDESQYEISWESDEWVTGSNSEDGFLETRVVISGNRTDGKYTGNYIGSTAKSYVIYGDLNPSPSSAGYGFTKTEITPRPIPYTTNGIQYNGVVVKFYQRRQNSTPPTASGYDKEHILTWGTDYEVRCESERVGVHEGAIVEGKGNYINWQTTTIVIQGDLGNDSYTECKLKSGSDTIAYVPGQQIVLQDLITVICGGKTLVYGTDYIFQDDPTANLGENHVVILPTDSAKQAGYLTGELDFKYYVKSDLESDAIIGNVEKEYDYAHGEPVIDPAQITVTIGSNRPLRYQEDYDVEIDDAVNVGKHTIKIIGKGNYSGTRTENFTINPYHLKNGWDRGEVKVRYKEAVTYTGSTVYPEIESVTVTKKSGGTATLTAGDSETPANYAIRSGSQGDHVNWTDTQSGDVKPDFILGGQGNYTGDLSFEYLIERKYINEDDVLFGTIEPQPYQNGKDVAPIPTATYLGKDLSGVPYSGNANEYVNWKDYTKHFTWQHLDINDGNDIKSVGQKKIKIRGIGNFIGETERTYTVIPLDISLAELNYTYDTPVYNGKPQKPAFTLTYAGDTILEYTGEKIVSEFIKSPVVEFENNINATKTAVLRISIADENDNYTGVKEVTFIILPASLTNHTKFSYRPVNQEGIVDLSAYKMSMDFIEGQTRLPKYAASATLNEEEVGVFFNDTKSENHGAILINETDFDVSYMYVEPDTDDVEIREEYRNPTPPFSYAGKVKVTITGKNNYADEASFWYFIGNDISTDAKISIAPTTTIYNSQPQPPKVTISGVDKDKCTIAEYRNEVAVENLIKDRNRDFINAGTYYIRVEGNPMKGTYSTKPETLTFTITPRAFSNNLIIDGFKREYSYTGYDICPVGISVTDYIDNIKYRLTEDVDYTLTYTNNLNAGTAYINVEGKNNFSGKATANFMITSSTISSGGSWGSNSFLDQGTGEISGSSAVAPSDVSLSMDTVDAMYYTGRAVYPKVSVPGMTENVDYTVTFSNNVEVGTAVATITGIGNNNGTITKNFRIIAQLSKCTISPIPAQQYTGSEVKPALTVKCGNNILMEGTDYTATYSNNVNIGTATVTLRALNNANYTGTTTVTFSIANDVGGFIISGYAPSYAYTGNAITPGVVVETGSRTLVLGTEYTVSYANNVNAGTATITVTGVGRYSGTQTATFVIEPKSMQSLDTSDVADRTYTGDAYTPDITVSDGGKVLTKGVDYTVTYKNNTDPGVASIVIEGLNSNYAGTKIVSFKISAVAVSGLKASSVKYNSIKLKWTKQAYATGYQICDSNSKVIKTVKANSATITGLSAGKTYKYKVRSYVKNTDGTRSYGAFSSVLSTTTKLKTPTVKVVSNAKGQARISWSKVTGASGYEIYYKKTATAKYKKLKTVNNPNIRVCTVRGMKSGDRAYFRVRAFRKNGSKKVYSALNPLKVITVK
ncbi:MAG: fibronectin type III domain-containing protein [Eubacterium sp.]|nr:fibronectin type III domain-containing protein [Eubacterium sp.]